MPKVKKQTKPQQHAENSIFAPKDKNLEMSVVKKKIVDIEKEVEGETEPQPLTPVAPVKQKRAYRKGENFMTDKKRKQLANARKRSLESRRKRKEEARLYREQKKAPEPKYDPRYDEVSDEDEFVDTRGATPTPAPTPNQPYNSSPLRNEQNFDYNRITDMVYNRFKTEIHEEQQAKLKRQQDAKRIRDYEDKIRADERAKVEAKFSNYTGSRHQRRPSRNPRQQPPTTPRPSHRSKYNLGVRGDGGAFGNFW